MDNSETEHATDTVSKELADSKRENEQLFNEMSQLNNELVNVQRELAIKNVRLEQLNDLKNQLLGMATHDLRNPLASILSGCRIIERNVESADKIKLTVHEIKKVSGFMLHLVESLLDVSKIESGKLALKKTVTDIGEMLTHIVKNQRSYARHKDIELSLSLSELLPRLDIDALKIEQALTNLINNAIKFSPKGTKVRVLAGLENDELVIKVEDQGPGIPEQEQSRLFKQFSRTSVRPTGDESSHGLGLSIAKNFVEAHQGRIWMESQVGGGSRFILALPV